MDGTKILRETWGNNVLIPLYDNEDTVCGIEYNGSAYWFYKNLQGDIIAITDSNGDVIAKYTYDAWGKVCSIIDTDGNAITDGTNIAIINPYRYRSYYYDTEIGMYYLQSRYYNSTVGRFINADDGMFTSTATTSNLFCYCLNTPVSCDDRDGHIPYFIMNPAALVLSLLKGLSRKVVDNIGLSIAMYVYSMYVKNNNPFINFNLQKSIIITLLKKRLENSNLVRHRIFLYTRKAPKIKNVYKKTEFVNFINYSGKNSSDRDLALSVGKASIFRVTVKNMGRTFLTNYLNRTTYWVQIYLYDEYDFHELKTNVNLSYDLLVLLNNIGGYVPMKKGVLKKYRWEFTHIFFVNFIG